VNIPKHRKAIDKLDAQIAKLLNERAKHAPNAVQNLASGKIRIDVS